MMYMADATGDQKYLDAAKKLFRWGENMLCDDGGLYNDAQSTWNGITVFNAVSLCDALKKHGHLLDAQTKREWEARLLRMGDWLFKNLRLGMRTNINYFATNCNAMALLGNYFDRDDYRQLAHELAHHCMKHISENGLLFGEGQPNDAVSEKGKYLGTGFLSRQSKIRVRLVSRNANDRFDEAFWQRRIQYAWDYRKTVMGSDLSCCRVIFGEADGFPGLTVDRFSDLLVTQTLSAGMERLKLMLFPLLVKVLRQDGQEIRGILSATMLPSGRWRGWNRTRAGSLWTESLCRKAP